MIRVIAAPGSLIGWKDLGADITEKRVCYARELILIRTASTRTSPRSSPSSWTGFMTSGSG